MQTFIPYSNFDKTARCLDNKRLGNQVYREGLTLIRGGWKNHPASKMWVGHEYALADYCIACLNELKRRGRDYPKWFIYFKMVKIEKENTGFPSWIGDDRVHKSHRAKLYWKDREHYKEFHKDYTDLVDLDEEPEYYWPVK